MRYQRPVIIALIALTAVGSIYFLSRAQGRRPASASTSMDEDVAVDRKVPAKTHATTRAAAMLLPRDVRLADFFSELQARTDAGDVAAATRLYRDLSICRSIRSIDLATSGFSSEILSERIDEMKPEQLESYRARLDVVESNKQSMQRLRDMCGGVSKTMLDSMVPNLRKAAQLGEEHARACYLSRGPNYDARGLVSHPEWLESYRSSVSSLVSSGIEAGDWKVVDILRNAYQPDAEGMLTGVLGSDPYQYYRYLKLYRLGAEPYRVDKLNEQLAAAAARLTQDQLAEADAWAENIFHRNFNASNSTESTVAGWNSCEFPYE